MNNRDYRIIGFIIGACLISTAAQAEALRGNNEHARKWNKFADDVLALHNDLIEAKEVKKTSKVGGYSGNEKFYIEENHYDKKTGKLISRVRWERKNPDVLHTIEVNVHDKQGRVVRDYVAAYLPNYYNAPTQTLINLHNYNGDLHAFRTFDAGGDRIGEQCSGKHNGKEFFLLLDEDEIYAALDGYSNDMDQPAYRACFDGLPEEVHQYVKNPH